MEPKQEALFRDFSRCSLMGWLRVKAWSIIKARVWAWKHCLSHTYDIKHCLSHTHDIFEAHTRARVCASNTVCHTRISYICHTRMTYIHEQKQIYVQTIYTKGMLGAVRNRSTRVCAHTLTLKQAFKKTEDFNSEILLSLSLLMFSQHPLSIESQIKNAWACFGDQNQYTYANSSLSTLPGSFISSHICIYIYVYIYIFIHMYMYIYICM
jgi:hypothetical protein